MRLADAPLKLLECPSCWAPFHPFLRGAVHRSKWSWRTLWLRIGSPRLHCALICSACKNIVGWERA